MRGARGDIGGLAWLEKTGPTCLPFSVDVSRVSDKDTLDFALRRDPTVIQAERDHACLNRTATVFHSRRSPSRPTRHQFDLTVVDRVAGLICLADDVAVLKRNGTKKVRVAQPGHSV